MQRDSVLGPGLLDDFCALFTGVLVGLKGEGDLGAGLDGGEENAEGGGVFDGLGGALGDIWTSHISVELCMAIWREGRD